MKKNCKKVGLNNNKKTMIGILLISIFLVACLITYLITFINNKEFLSNDELSNNSKIAIYIDGVSVSTLPQKNRGYVFDHVSCSNGTATWDNDNWGLFVPLSLNEKCYVYFNYNGIWLYDYTGSSQEFVAAKSGSYKFELWGAVGGSGRKNGTEQVPSGTGGYTKGEITLQQGDRYYIYVGGRGNPAVVGKDVAGGWNGGGGGSWDRNDDEADGGGGGATDVRIVSGDWDNADSLASRIMVAGGAGGCGYYCNTNVAAGGLSSYSMNTKIPIATQTSGNAFGIGKTGVSYYGNTYGKGGGGGGYYGGGSVADSTSSSNTSAGYDGGAGGSSYISGHTGCVAITSQSTLDARTGTGGEACSEGGTDNLCSIHYSNNVFTNTVMVDGQGYEWTNIKGSQTGMPTHDGTSTMNGNDGNGYAKITYLGS